jgi:hypothetical protein
VLVKTREPNLPRLIQQIGAVSAIANTANRPEVTAQGLLIASAARKRSVFAVRDGEARISIKQPFAGGGGRAMEMTACGKPGKPKTGFPSFPPPLEIAARFPHSHSSDDSTHTSRPKKHQTVLAIASSLQGPHLEPMIWQA